MFPAGDVCSAPLHWVFIWWLSAAGSGLDASEAEKTQPAAGVICQLLPDGVEWGSGEAGHREAPWESCVTAVPVVLGRDAGLAGCDTSPGLGGRRLLVLEQGCTKLRKTPVQSQLRPERRPCAPRRARGADRPSLPHCPCVSSWETSVAAAHGARVQPHTSVREQVNFQMN